MLFQDVPTSSYLGRDTMRTLKTKVKNGAITGHAGKSRPQAELYRDVQNAKKYAYSLTSVYCRDRLMTLLFRWYTVAKSIR